MARRTGLAALRVDDLRAGQQLNLRPAVDQVGDHHAGAGFAQHALNALGFGQLAVAFQLLPALFGALLQPDGQPVPQHEQQHTNGQNDYQRPADAPDLFLACAVVRLALCLLIGECGAALRGCAGLGGGNDCAGCLIGGLLPPELGT